MFKITCFTILISLTCINLQAQDVFGFPVDEKGKITFYESIEQDSFPQSRLFSNAKVFLEGKSRVKKKSSLKADEKTGTLTAEVGFIVYYKSLVAKHPHGEIVYDVKVEVKDNRYRYIINNFRFYYYKLDARSGKGQYVATGKKKYLENPTFKGRQDEWDEHRKRTKRHVELLVKRLKEQMKFEPIPESERIQEVFEEGNKPVIIDEDW